MAGGWHGDDKSSLMTAPAAQMSHSMALLELDGRGHRESYEAEETRA
jgi:hypothetical protein